MLCLRLGSSHLGNLFINSIMIDISCSFQGLESLIVTSVLLLGPTGVGKKLVAQAVANEAGVNFIHVKVCFGHKKIFSHFFCVTVFLISLLKY